MIIQRTKHWQFLEDELRAETEVFDKKFCARAESLLQEKGDIFVAQFITFRKEGDMVVRFPITRNIPRRGEYLFCMVLPKELRDYRNWGNKTYQDLFNERYKGTECICQWSAISEDKKYKLVGFRDIDLDFSTFIQNTPYLILVFAPKRPPIDYLGHLQQIVNDKNSKGVASILDSDYQTKNWTPILIKQKDVSKFVLSQLNLSDTMIIQGPPGTGKTHMIAEICAAVCAQGYSVLVTALTNRALIEIASKSPVDILLAEGKILKTNMKTDEAKEIPRLKSIKKICPIPSSVVLSTFYISSGYAAELVSETPFDYVIMDEASQAFTAMFAASKKLGKRNLWVGDIKQMAPIINLNEDRVREYDYDKMINGFKLLSYNCNLPNYQLTTAWRFSQRAADYTGIFYNGTLLSNQPNFVGAIQSIKKILNECGGPSLILTDMPLGDEKPEFAIKIVTYIVNRILKENKKKEIAVLTCMISTTRVLQNSIFYYVGNFTNVIVETIARVQGLTTDITIVVIPNVSLIRSLESHLFNVATSRAKEHTIIIADKNIINYEYMDANVRDFICLLSKDQCTYIPSTLSDSEHIGNYLLLE